jgi:glutamate racemase
LLRPVIEQVVGDGVAVVDSAFTTALATEDLLDALGARAASGPTQHRVATTGRLDDFRVVAEQVFGAALPGLETVTVEGD